MATSIRRAQPWLGTFVEVRVEGLDAAPAARAIDRAFAEIAAIHRLMSFHQAGSDLDRLHCARPAVRVRVDARTHQVLGTALRIAEASGGAFDPTVAAHQVARGRLPRPASTWSPDAFADWRDIELCAGYHVRLSRPAWIDLGGIAKGYAVDRALQILADAGAAQICVNAGGDLRVAGGRTEIVHLRAAERFAPMAALELANGAVATSDAGRNIVRRVPAPAATHENPDRHARRGRIVSVAAPTCLIADALTKVVGTCDADASSAVLARFQAQACVEQARSGWPRLGAAA